MYLFPKVIGILPPCELILTESGAYHGPQASTTETGLKRLGSQAVLIPNSAGTKWSICTSPDGSTWTVVFEIDAATGRIHLTPIYPD
jgi:hypothetical protein